RRPHSLSDHEDGQPASICSSTASVPVPLTQSIIPFQNVPAPTADGMRSDASKRNVVVSACRISMAADRMLLDALAGSSPLLAEITPPRLTRELAHSGLERYSCT